MRNRFTEEEKKHMNYKSPEDNGDFSLLATFFAIMEIAIPSGIVIFFLWLFLRAIGWL